MVGLAATVKLVPCASAPTVLLWRCTTGAHQSVERLSAPDQGEFILNLCAKAIKSIVEQQATFWRVGGFMYQIMVFMIQKLQSKLSFQFWVFYHISSLPILNTSSASEGGDCVQGQHQ